MSTWDIAGWLGALGASRPVFHSEADFQHALAWEIHQSDPEAWLRLEARPEPGMHLDMLVSRPDRDEHLAVELKYLTAAWSGQVGGEAFTLLSQGAQDIRAYDVIKDIARVERLVHGRAGWSGAVLVLSNDPGYWSRPAHGRATNAQDFRIYQDQALSGRRAWGPGTGAGTSRGREHDLELRGEYRCDWAGYSALPGNRGAFRLLAFMVGDAPSPQPGLSSPAAASAHGDHGPVPPASAVGRPPAAQPAGERDVRYSIGDLRDELDRFERELRAARLRENSIDTYIGRSRVFLKWLNGEYRPQGPRP